MLNSNKELAELKTISSSLISELGPKLTPERRGKARTISLCVSEGKIVGAAEYYLGPNETALIIEAPNIALESSELAKLSARINPHLTADLTAELSLHIDQNGAAHFAFIRAGNGMARQICDLADKYGWAVGAEPERRWGEADEKDNAPIANDRAVLERDSWSNPIMAYGEDRGVAIKKIHHKLDRHIAPIGESHKELLSVIFGHERFERGDMNNDFMAEEFPKGFDIVDLGIGHYRYIAAIAAILMSRAQEASQKSAQKSVQKSAAQNSRWSATVSSAVSLHAFTIGLNITPALIMATIDDDSEKATLEIEVETSWRAGDRVAEMQIDGRLMIVQARPKDEAGFIITYRGGLVDVSLERLLE